MNNLPANISVFTISNKTNMSKPASLSFKNGIANISFDMLRQTRSSPFNDGSHHHSLPMTAREFMMLTINLTGEKITKESRAAPNRKSQ